MLILSIFIVGSWFSSIEAEDDWDKRVYLATYPRSGNHWMRYLIEEATHIATASVYCDQDKPPHLKTAFPWGYSVKQGYKGDCRYPAPWEPVVLKTHFPANRSTRFDNQSRIKAIRIVRHPVDSFYSYFVFINQGNVPADAIIPENLLKYFIQSWREFQEYWDQQDDVLTIRYEDLYNKPGYYLKKVLNAIGYKYKKSDILRSVSKNAPQGGLLKHIHHFSSEDLELIQNELQDLMEKYDYDMTPPKQNNCIIQVKPAKKV